MQIVIEIPEACLNDIKRNRYLYEEDNEFLAKQIANGMPIPKGHGDLVDISTAKSKLQSCYYDFSDNDISLILKGLKRLQAVIPADKGEIS